MGMSVEVGGISPFVSANFEFVPFKTKTSFGVIRVGAGFKSTNASQSVSVPFSFTYNFLMNRKKDCDAAPQRVFRENFLEAGLGMSYVSSLGKQPVLYFAPIVGIRKQFIQWGKSEVLFYKIHLTPIYVEQRFKFGAGLSFGCSI